MQNYPLTFADCSKHIGNQWVELCLNGGDVERVCQMCLKTCCCDHRDGHMKRETYVQKICEYLEDFDRSQKEAMKGCKNIVKIRETFRCQYEEGQKKLLTEIERELIRQVEEYNIICENVVKLKQILLSLVRLNEYFVTLSSLNLIQLKLQLSNEKGAKVFHNKFITYINLKQQEGKMHEYWVKLKEEEKKLEVMKQTNLNDQLRLSFKGKKAGESNGKSNDRASPYKNMRK